MQILGAGFQIMGGIFQRDAITRATEERMKQMRIQAAQRIGQATATVGGSGVELTSSTVQNHLNAMKVEFDRAIREVGNQGQSAADATILSALGGGAASMFKGFSDYAAEQDALGQKTSPGVAGLDPIWANWKQPNLKLDWKP